MAGRVGYDPETGRLTLDGQPLERHDPRMYGSVGRYILGDGSTFTDEAGNYIGDFADTAGYDPQYYEQYAVHEGDNGEVMRWRLKPEISERLGGRIQLTQSGVGGYSEVIDPSKVEWDDEFGLLTTPDNYGESDHGGGLSGFLSKNPWALMLPAAWGALSAGGAFGGAEAGAANLAPGGSSGTAAFGTPGFGGSEWADLLATAADKPAMFGTPGFGAGESFFGADTLGLLGGGGELGTGTSLAGTGLGAGTVTGPLGSGFSLAGTGLAPGVVTGTGAVAGGGASFLDRLLEKAPQLLQALPGVTAALSGPPKLPGAGGGAGGSSLGSGGGGGSRAGRVEVEANPWLKAKPRDVLDLMSYIGGRK